MMLKTLAIDSTYLANPLILLRSTPLRFIVLSPAWRHWLLLFTINKIHVQLTKLRNIQVICHVWVFTSIFRNRYIPHTFVLKIEPKNRSSGCTSQYRALPLVQTGSGCAAASSRCPRVARKLQWRRRQCWGWRPHRDCRSRRSPWPPGQKSGPVCSPGRWDSSSRNSAPITEAGTHLNHTQIKSDQLGSAVKHVSHLGGTGPAAVNWKRSVCVCVWISVRDVLKSDLTSEVAYSVDWKQLAHCEQRAALWCSLEPCFFRTTLSPHPSSFCQAHFMHRLQSRLNPWLLFYTYPSYCLLTCKTTPWLEWICTQSEVNSSTDCLR